MNFDAVREILEAAAKREELDKYEIYYTYDESISAETLGDEISSFSGGTQGGVSFRCIVDGHMGTASTELIKDEELCELVSRAKANAQVIESDNAAVIFAGSEQYAQLTKTQFEMPSSAELKTVALNIQRATYSQSEFVTDGTQSAVFAQKGVYELANSEGLRLSNTFGVKGAYAVAVVSKDGEASDSFDAKLGYDGTESLSVSAVSDALSKIGAQGVPSGKQALIIEGKAMRSLLSTYCSVFSGKQAALGLSLLSGREGEKIAADCVTLVDEPYGEHNPVPTSFDGEGVATYPKNVIENGVLSTLLYDITYAGRVGRQSTGNGQRPSYASQVGIAPYCFYIKEGTLTDEQLIGRLGDGIYVTELKGLHAGADAVTGDFSLESAGYLVRDGKIAGAVKGFTVAGNFYDLLKGIEAVSCNVKFGLPGGFTTFGSPDVLISEISVAGI